MDILERYEWIVAYCEDRDFVGRLFRPSDVQYGLWPEGTVFTNVRTGVVKVWYSDGVRQARVERAGVEGARREGAKVEEWK